MGTDGARCRPASRIAHAAALALVGWYLMVPPLEDNPKGPSPPLSQWVVYAAFDSGERCTRALAEVRDYATKKAAHAKKVVDEDSARAASPPRTSSDRAKFAALAWQRACDRVDARLAKNVLVRFDAAQCIATDDPRLAK